MMDCVGQMIASAVRSNDSWSGGSLSSFHDVRFWGSELVLVITISSGEPSQSTSVIQVPGCCACCAHARVMAGMNPIRAPRAATDASSRSAFVPPFIFLIVVWTSLLPGWARRRLFDGFIPYIRHHVNKLW